MPFTIEKERDSLYKDGLQKGREKGLERGSYETKIAIAKALLKQDIDIEVIIKSTGLSRQEVEKLSEGI